MVPFYIEVVRAGVQLGSRGWTSSRKVRFCVYSTCSASAFVPYPVIFFLQSKYRQHPGSFKYTAVTDTPSLLHAKLSNQITNEVKLDGFRMGFCKTARLFEICLNMCRSGAGRKNTCLHESLERTS